MGTNISHLLKKSFVFYGALSLGAFLFGGLFIPGEWYQQLNKAPWTPPNIAFPIVWSVLYCMIALAGFKSSKSNDSTLLRLWYVQLAFNAIWSWVFFGQHWIFLGLVNLIILVGLVGALISRSIKTAQSTIAMLIAPYFAWLCLATSLNLYIFIFN